MRRGPCAESSEVSEGCLNVPLKWHLIAGTACLLRFLDAGPGVAEGDGAVEDQAFRGTLRIDAKIPQTLELTTITG